MQKFYTNAFISGMCLLLLSLLLVYACVSRSYLSLPLVPVSESELLWRAVPRTDVEEGGSSQVNILDDQFSLSFDYTLTSKAQYPYAEVALVFVDESRQPRQVDLTAYDAISFNTKCSPANTMVLSVYTIEQGVPLTDKLVSYRAPSSYFSCGQDWSSVHLDLTRLETPQWWFDLHKLDLSRQEYRLDKVPRIAIGNSFQSPANQTVSVLINNITLSGRDWRYLYFLAGFLLLAWSGFAVWLIKQYTRSLVQSLARKRERDRPLLAYQQLSIAPLRDREKTAILQYMASEYANPELDLDTMVAAINITRAKINEILKSELGYTFISYLNKLRLTEAARLLADKPEANVGEIAYSVGYKNTSYFNKLFKEEYGCTPKTYKSVCKNP
ncbi:helix-turn-helix domain-containing protein [Cellvibrio fontiphilus]|uniref:Helix-turn-helix domain-containing protein n=1 Tax=Cellvibrio fontiphilus TaxID=1815559 RepID=A0ABV7F8W8_9GAMM